MLPKKFSFASFTQSPLFRFIQSHAPDRRVDHAKLIKDVLGEVQKVDETQNMHLFCQRILFEDKVAKMSCLAQGKGSTTSRDVALKFLEGLTRHPSILIVDHPTSVELRQLDDDES